MSLRSTWMSHAFPWKFLLIILTMIVNSFQKCFGNWKVNNNRFSILSEIATDAIYASTAYSGSIDGWAFSTTSDINKEKYRIKPVFFQFNFFSNVILHLFKILKQNWRSKKKKVEIVVWFYTSLFWFQINEYPLLLMKLVFRHRQGSRLLD